MMAKQGLASTRLVLRTRRTLRGGRRIGFLVDILDVFFLLVFFFVGGGVMAAAMASRALGCCRSSFEVDDERCDAGWSRKISGHVVIQLPSRFKFCGKFWRGSASGHLSHWGQLSCFY